MRDKMGDMRHVSTKKHIGLPGWQGHGCREIETRSPPGRLCGVFGIEEGIPGSVIPAAHGTPI